MFVDPPDPLNNTLDLVLPSGVPGGTTIKEWDPISDAYTTLSVFNSQSGWSINYTLAPGDGAVLNAPSAFNVTFWGIVLDDFEEFVYNEGNPASDWLPPAINTPGTFLLSCEVPIDQAPFQQVVGRDPLDGESVEQWNAASQTDSTTTYEGGTWSNGAPALAVGEAALFTLVPEPGTITLLGAAAAAGLACVWRRRGRSRARGRVSVTTWFTTATSAAGSQTPPDRRLRGAKLRRNRLQPLLRRHAQDVADHHADELIERRG